MAIMRYFFIVPPLQCDQHKAPSVTPSKRSFTWDLAAVSFSSACVMLIICRGVEGREGSFAFLVIIFFFFFLSQTNFSLPFYSCFPFPDPFSFLSLPPCTASTYSCTRICWLQQLLAGMGQLPKGTYEVCGRTGNQHPIKMPNHHFQKLKCHLCILLAQSTGKTPGLTCLSMGMEETLC